MLIRILEITVPVFGIIALAYFYGRRRPTDLRDANRLNIVIFTPALIFHALTERSSGGEHFLMAAVGAAVIVLGSGMLAWIWVRATRRDPAIYVGPAMFNNCGNLGLPLAILAFGEDALPLAVVLLVTENLLPALCHQIRSASLRSAGAASMAADSIAAPNAMRFRKSARL
ncbi:AEC family transporter [Halomonas sp.]|uniref:AEC family transporter n=1 Tax=Halomonas sp. TaxID=1486246 RepID=UPI0035664292